MTVEGETIGNIIDPNSAMLSPYRILDLTDEKGIYCGQLLGSLGADVIKIEPPGGDSSRSVSQLTEDKPDHEHSLYWRSDRKSVV